MEESPEIVINKLKILEPIKIDVKTFQNEKEFEDYYNLNKKSLEDSTTTRLNRMFKIPGYRITRVKNELCLKKDYAKKTEQQQVETKDYSYDIEDLNYKIDDIKTMIEELKNNFTKINVKLMKCEKVIKEHSEFLSQIS
ncbi:hypothetical protein TRFO_29957 [Tritrichomonas foetus]|uniref:Uncharacterized protein n=1 Tax=Tritrichomonas foetus TaxID=1144522 RepID=A0A1J4JUY8_9EUKA|nr:hypothetical protein TRFO_29957 [Tritrichomonas foetus]|eukprot:OHT02819.1 hypothetical protein TRFO_29957 [Tritrichomonas foetus]